MKKILLLMCCAIFSMSLYAQMSGGQIRRSNPKARQNLSRKTIRRQNPATPNDSKGCQEKGKSLRSEDGYKAIKIFEKAYQIGDYPYNYLSLWQVGLIYYVGFGGVTTNFSRAVEYFRKSYNGGCKEAGYMLGVCYEYGRGVDKDVAMAREYYKQSGYNISNSPSWDK